VKQARRVPEARTAAVVKAAIAHKVLEMLAERGLL
jgi:hypothetical protein